MKVLRVGVFLQSSRKSLWYFANLEFYLSGTVLVPLKRDKQGFIVIPKKMILIIE